MRVLNDDTAPETWPACTQCGHAYKFCRRTDRWTWQPDCRHRSAPVLTTIDGPADHYDRIVMSNGMRLSCTRCSWYALVFHDEDDHEAADRAFAGAGDLEADHDRQHEDDGLGYRTAQGVVGGTEPAEQIIRRMRGDD